MRFIVYGAGAIGGVIGARLFSSGQDVVLIARGAHYEAIRKDGLHLETPDGSTVCDVAVVDHPGALDLGADDVVVLAMKTQDTAAALDALGVTAPSEVTVVCAQNGVENERLALRHFSAVYGVCVMLPATHLSAGVVQALSVPTPGILDIGVAGKGRADKAEAIASCLARAGFSSHAVTDIMRWKYAKLVMNLGNAVEAMCGPEARVSEISVLCRREGIGVLEAAGIEFVRDEEFAARRGNLITPKAFGDQPRAGDSSWQSLARGTGAIEANYLNGEIGLLGRLYGIPTPVNSMLQREANRMAADRRPPGTRTPDELMALVVAPGGAP
jgi:2-dehydropantoate 2-reductase